MTRLLLALWQFPQYLLGPAVAAILGAKRDGRGIYTVGIRFGVSLGPVIILWQGYDNTVLCHVGNLGKGNLGKSGDTILISPIISIASPS